MTVTVAADYGGIRITWNVRLMRRRTRIPCPFSPEPFPPITPIDWVANIVWKRCI